MTGYTLKEIAPMIADAPAIVVLPESTPNDAMRRFFERFDHDDEDTLSDLIVVDCQSDQAASEMSKEFCAEFIRHVHIK